MRFTVIGAGSYGTCLAKLFSDAGHTVTLWCRSEELAAQISASRENAPYLPGYFLSPTVAITSDLAAAVDGAEIVFGVTPSHAVRSVLGSIASSLSPETIVVNASKGLEEGSLQTLDKVYEDVFSAQIAERACYLSGPTFAKEIAAGLPGAIVLAGRDPDSAERVQRAIACETLRAYRTDDVTGVLVGGALKNVVAIAAGVSDGLGFGLNARAALITRGLAEIARIGLALGAKPITFSGLSGLGDLVLTCSGDLSRNRRVGLALGAGEKLDNIVREMRMVAEGVKTTKVAHELSASLGIDSPITAFMYDVLYQDVPAKTAIGRLMGRALKDERD